MGDPKITCEICGKQFSTRGMNGHKASKLCKAIGAGIKAELVDEIVIETEIKEPEIKSEPEIKEPEIKSEPEIKEPKIKEPETEVIMTKPKIETTKPTAIIESEQEVVRIQTTKPLETTSQKINKEKEKNIIEEILDSIFGPDDSEEEKEKNFIDSFLDSIFGADDDSED